jgi:hypothetical protein
MFKCPNCKEYTISFMSKVSAVPIRKYSGRGTTICKKCNTELTMPKWASLFEIVLFLIMFVPSFIFVNNFRYLYFYRLYFFVPLIIIYIILIIVLIPIIKKDNSE